MAFLIWIISNGTQLEATLWQTAANRTKPEAIFLVVCDPSMNEL